MENYSIYKHFEKEPPFWVRILGREDAWRIILEYQIKNGLLQQYSFFELWRFYMKMASMLNQLIKKEK
jgi:hypothetical protein